MEHLTDFTIHNFKRFKQLSLEDIGQFNLIVGDNNVGKTSVLEALLFNTNIIGYERVLAAILGEKGIFIERSKGRNYTNFLTLFFNNLTGIEQFSFDYKVLGDNSVKIFDFKIVRGGEENLSEKDRTALIKKNKEYVFGGRYGAGSYDRDLSVRYNNGELFFISPIEDHLKDSPTTYLDYIPFSKSYNSDLVRFYSEHIQRNKIAKNEFIKNLSSFIPNIEGIELTTRLRGDALDIEIGEKGINTLSPLMMYGDGAIKLVRILLQIAVAKGKRLMIDEIDTGIHYSRFKEFWKIILQAAKNYNVQLFATTHNWDCLNYYKEALEELTDEFREQSRVFTLMELPDKSVKAYNHKFKNFEFAIDGGIEIRGGNNGLIYQHS